MRIVSSRSRNRLRSGGPVWTTDSVSAFSNALFQCKDHELHHRPSPAFASNETPGLDSSCLSTLLVRNPIPIDGLKVSLDVFPRNFGLEHVSRTRKEAGWAENIDRPLDGFVHFRWGRERHRGLSAYCSPEHEILAILALDCGEIETLRLKGIQYAHACLDEIGDDVPAVSVAVVADRNIRPHFARRRDDGSVSRPEPLPVHIAAHQQAALSPEVIPNLDKIDAGFCILRRLEATDLKIGRASCRERV